MYDIYIYVYVNKYITYNVNKHLSCTRYIKNNIIN